MGPQLLLCQTNEIKKKIIRGDHKINTRRYDCIRASYIYARAINSRAMEEPIQHKSGSVKPCGKILLTKSRTLEKTKLYYIGI